MRLANDLKLRFFSKKNPEKRKNRGTAMLAMANDATLAVALSVSGNEWRAIIIMANVILVQSIGKYRFCGAMVSVVVIVPGGVLIYFCKGRHK